MSRKTVKYYNYLVKIVTTDPAESRQIASNINEWFGDTIANDLVWFGDSSAKLVRFSERKKKKGAK